MQDSSLTVYYAVLFLIAREVQDFGERECRLTTSAIHYGIRSVQRDLYELGVQVTFSIKTRGLESPEVSRAMAKAMPFLLDLWLTSLEEGVKMRRSAADLVIHQVGQVLPAEVVRRLQIIHAKFHREVFTKMHRPMILSSIIATA